jgi:NAD(P)-dependent dehydrogenase (short-subunit alcohol dehydrogenase family)
VLVNNAALGSATVRAYLDACPSPMTSPAVAAGVDLVSNGSSSKATAPAGISSSSRKAAEDDALMRVNALGPLWVTEALMPLVRSGGGSDAPGDRGYGTVIFIGSVGGGSAAVFPEYCSADLMSKAAMTYLAKHLAAQHCRDIHVDVMCVSPGATETDMFRASTLSKMTPDDAAQFVDGMPKHCLIQPDDIARIVLWLASDPAARVFNGAVLDASMGLAVRPGLQTEAGRRQ